MLLSVACGNGPLLPTMGPKGAEPNVERKHQSHPEIQGPFPAGTGRQGERGAADRLEMGAGPVRPGLRPAHRPVGGSGDARQHPAGGDGGGVGGGRDQGPLGKAGDHQSAVCTEKGHAALGSPLAARRGVRGHPGRGWSPGGGEQPLPGLGLQRPGDCRHGGGPPRL